MLSGCLTDVKPTFNQYSIEENSIDKNNNILPQPKEEKHKYGEYKNVLLTDKELEKLKEDYSNYEDLIKYLDEYIEMKGYKAKSHYLAIRKWVVDAVKGKPQEKKQFQDYKQRDYSDIDLEKLYSN